MIPIFLHEADSKRGYLYRDFETDFLNICDQHRVHQRALFFAFILYDFTSPQVAKMLDDHNYWLALDKISGKKLSVFSFHTTPWVISSRCKEAELNIDPDEKTQIMLSKYFDTEDAISYPSLLFFQVEKQTLIDHFWLKVKSEKIEEVFIEIKRSIVESVKSVKGVLPENYKNSQDIFNLVRRGLSDQNFRIVMSKAIKNAPNVASLIGLLSLFL